MPFRRCTTACLLNAGLLLLFGWGTPHLAHGEQQAKQPRLSICYNVAVPPEQLRPFDILVLDSAHPIDGLRRLKQQRKLVFGYLSLGAVDKARWWYRELAAAQALGGRNPGFTSTQIDLANPAWPRLVERRIVPEMLERGFDGIFLDDLDLAFQNKQHDAAVRLIAGIRARHPRLRLMANRGLEYLEKFAKDVDYVLLESCVAQRGELRPGSDLQWALSHLAKGRRANPKLQACALDYYARRSVPLTPRLEKLIGDIQQTHAAHGLISCVSVERLDAPPIQLGESGGQTKR